MSQQSKQYRMSFTVNYPPPGVTAEVGACEQQA